MSERFHEKEAEGRYQVEYKEKIESVKEIILDFISAQNLQPVFRAAIINGLPSNYSSNLIAAALIELKSSNEIRELGTRPNFSYKRVEKKLK
jgi:hypothetical protein